MTMPGALWLLVAIIAEVAATTALKATAGFTRPVPALVVIVGYAIAFYCLSRTLATIPTGVAYAVWSGVGIVLISIAGWLVYGQKLDRAALAGIVLILAGVLVIQLWSTSAA